MQQEISTKHSAEPDPLDITGLCLLSLNGGGVRGLSTLFILKGIMDRLSHERKILHQQQQMTAGFEALKQCDVFDHIGGTSTGGLIAIMLGRLEMDVDQWPILAQDTPPRIPPANFGHLLYQKYNPPLGITGVGTPSFPDNLSPERPTQGSLEPFP
ncbi:hypothetical protein BP6252_04795 [Coleophoma cylindrospora]|uniref:PNPLA domain-containing protein n=1 Tax=Coleophoma cylindrospora TaxID=1849047 RepID=A0A3D8S1I1_9HELO|nr:hypothetical protein BP6252_04795 [Coleophoma cylindrospora]